MELLSNIFAWEEFETPSLDFSIPNDVFSPLSFQSKERRLELWVDMLDIQTGSDAFTLILKQIILKSLQDGLTESNGTLRDFDFWDPEFRNSIIHESLWRLHDSSPTDFLYISGIMQVLIINGIAINIWSFFDWYNTETLQDEYLKILTSDISNYGELRSDSDLENSYLSSLIGEVGSLQSYLRLFGILRESGHMDDIQYLRQIRYFYNTWVIWYPQFVWLEKAWGINHFDILDVHWFSPALQDFIGLELYDSLHDWSEFTPEVLERLRDLCMFIMTIESAWWTDLINGVSTATSYTQVLNEIDSSREDMKYNSLDTRIRYAAKFYNQPNFEIPSRLQNILDSSGVSEQDKRDVETVSANIMQTPANITDPNGVWVQNLWEYNEPGRNMTDFSFDVEMKILLLFFFETQPEALRNIMLWKDERDSAQDLYAAHHSNAHEHKETNTLMNESLNKYYPL